MPSDDLFTDNDPTSRITGALCPVVLFAGSAGGQGTTMAMLTAAEIASAGAHMTKVLAVDFVTDSGDVSSALRLDDRAPTLTTFHVTRRPQSAILPAEKVNGFRPEKVPDISFDVAAAPAYVSANSSYISNSDKIEFINSMRRHANLILVDVGTPTYAFDATSSLDLIASLVSEGAWCVFLTSSSYVEVQRLERLTTLLDTEFRVGKDRLMTLMNKRRSAFSLDKHWETLRGEISTFSYPLSPVSYDEKGIADQYAQGKLPTGQVELSSALGEALLRASGQPNFSSIADGNSIETRQAGAARKETGGSMIREVSTAKRRFGRR